LAEIDKQKSTQRKNRGRLIRVALVGYTNVGKSTLMNLLSKSDVFAENKLFATLDTTVRKVVIRNLPFLLADTVGFIRKLPTDLVDSFKSTLDEVREADLLAACRRHLPSRLRGTDRGGQQDAQGTGMLPTSPRSSSSTRLTTTTGR
jgi:GTP-binding protein HflX